MSDYEEADDADEPLTKEEQAEALEWVRDEAYAIGRADGREEGLHEGRLDMLKSVSSLNGSTDAVLDFVRKAFKSTGKTNDGNTGHRTDSRTDDSVRSGLESDTSAAKAVIPELELLDAAAEYVQACHDDGTDPDDGLHRLYDLDADELERIASGTVEKAFDSNEARDEAGRWTESGGKRKSTNTKASIKTFAASLGENPRVQRKLISDLVYDFQENNGARSGEEWARQLHDAVMNGETDVFDEAADLKTYDVDPRKGESARAYYTRLTEAGVAMPTWDELAADMDAPYTVDDLTAEDLSEEQAVSDARDELAEGVKKQWATAILKHFTDGTIEKAWRREDHPRGKNGQFIDKREIEAAKSDPEKAKELREQVKPEDAGKLEDALAGKTDLRNKRETARDESRQKREKVQASRTEAKRLADKLQLLQGDATADDYRALIPHLSTLTHDELSYLRTMLSTQGASFGGETRLEERRKRLLDWARGQAEGVETPAATDIPPTAATGDNSSVNNQQTVPEATDFRGPVPKAGDQVELNDGTVVTVEGVTDRRGRGDVRNVDVQFTHPEGFKANARWSGTGDTHVKRTIPATPGDTAPPAKDAAPQPEPNRDGLPPARFGEVPPDLASHIHDIAKEMFAANPRYARTGMVPIPRLRDAIREKFGEAASGKAFDDAMLFELRNGNHGRLIPADNRSAFEKDDLHKGVLAVGDNYQFYGPDSSETDANGNYKWEGAGPQRETQSPQAAPQPVPQSAAKKPRAAKPKTGHAAVKDMAKKEKDAQAKDWLESALHNAKKGDDADLAKTLGASIEESGTEAGSGKHITRPIPPAAIEAGRRALQALGAEEHGTTGAGTFDARYHQPVPGVFPGQPVKVVRPALVLNGNVVSRGKVGAAGGSPAPATENREKDVAALRKEIVGTQMVTQRRAHHGEVGPNGEVYPGGAFIATQDIPKRVKDKLKRAATGRVRVGATDFAVPEPGQMSIVDKLGGTVMNPRTGEINEQYLLYIGASEEQRAAYSDLANKHKAGQQWVSVNDYPQLANLTDAARLYIAGKPIPGAVLDKLPPEFRERLHKYQPPPTFEGMGAGNSQNNPSTPVDKPTPASNNTPIPPTSGGSMMEGGKMNSPTMNGKPLDAVLSAKRAADYHQLIGINSGKSGDDVEAGQIIRAGLHGGISPGQIRATLAGLSVDSERVNRLLSRAIEQTGYAEGAA